MARETYFEAIADAKELLHEFGQDCWWQKPAPMNGGVPGYPVAGALPQLIPCVIAFFTPRDLNRGRMEFLGHIPDTEIPDNTQIGLMAGGLSFAPELTDMFRRGAVDANPVSLIQIDLLAPNGVPVLYYLTVAA